MLRDRLDPLQRCFPVVMPRITRTVLLGESAGTHTLVALHGLLKSTAWEPDRVVMSALAMPKFVMAKVLKTSP